MARRPDSPALCRLPVEGQAEAAMCSTRDHAGLNPDVFSIAGTFAHILGLMRDEGDAFVKAIEDFDLLCRARLNTS
jgi:hypothetical protein